jgi:hypothetical protein
MAGGVAADLAKASKTWPATKGQGAERLADLAVKALQEAVAAPGPAPGGED